MFVSPFGSALLLPNRYSLLGLFANGYKSDHPVVTICNTGMQASMLAHIISIAVPETSPRVYNVSLRLEPSIRSAILIIIRAQWKRWNCVIPRESPAAEVTCLTEVPDRIHSLERLTGLSRKILTNFLGFHLRHDLWAQRTSFNLLFLSSFLCKFMSMELFNRTLLSIRCYLGFELFYYLFFLQFSAVKRCDRPA